MASKRAEQPLARRARGPDGGGPGFRIASVLLLACSITAAGILSGGGSNGDGATTQSSARQQAVPPAGGTAQPPAAPASAGPTVLTVEQLRIRLRQVRGARAKIHNALESLDRLDGQLSGSGLDSGPGSAALEAQLRERDALLATTEHQLLLQLARMEKLQQPVRTPRQAAPTAPVPAQKPAAILAGPGCPSSSGHLFGAYASGHDDGWTRERSGWHGNGCDGTDKYTGRTGSATHWEDGADWVFRDTPGRRCTVRVYIPDSVHAAGPAAYDMYDAADADFADRIGTVTIDQALHRGHWVNAGTYQFRTRLADISLTDRGSGRTSVAASAVAITCT